MATSISCVLILGHSFIRRLCEFISSHTNDFNVNFRLAEVVVTSCHSVWGRTVAKTLQFDLPIASSFGPDIVILQLSSNDLVTFSPLHVGSIIEDLIRLSHTLQGVKLVCVCQTLRQGNTVFSSRVGLLTRYLRVVLEHLPYAIFWGHRGFWKAQANVYAVDGIHLNGLGQHKLYESSRGSSLFITPFTSCSELRIWLHFGI